LGEYISIVAKDRKSPQEKKQLEYTKEHFTFGWYSSRAFPKTWKRKKTNANREYRRKTEQLLAQTRPGIEADDAQLMTDDLSTKRLAKKSIVRKVLHKAGTVTVGEKVRLTLEKRKDLVGRRVQRRKQSDDEAASAIATLRSLKGDRLLDFVRRASLLCSSGYVDESTRVATSTDPVDRALSFLYQVVSGRSCGPISPREALCRNPELENELTIWLEKANRILRRDRGAIERKLNQQQATKKKLRGRAAQVRA
jgi:hypothetical protein